MTADQSLGNTTQDWHTITNTNTLVITSPCFVWGSELGIMITSNINYFVTLLHGSLLMRYNAL